jgi:ABC-type polysaccharide/polyol phosphate export permease
METQMADQLTGPPAELRFRRRVDLVGSVKEVWRARGLIRTLAERDLRVRYKQAFLGLAWAIVTPLIMMLVFTLLIRRALTVDTGGAPYQLFSYLGLLPWGFFAAVVSSGGNSLVGNRALLQKLHCPREVFPIASLVVAAFEAGIQVLMLGVLFIVFGYAPKAQSVWALLLLPIPVAFSLGAALILASVIVYLRDVRHALPIILQLGLFATPVAYGIEIIPQHLRGFYALLNPLGPVIDGYRRTILLGKQPDWDLVGLAAITATMVLLGGFALFKRLETGFADVV